MDFDQDPKEVAYKAAGQNPLDAALAKNEDIMKKHDDVKAAEEESEAETVWEQSDRPSGYKKAHMVTTNAGGSLIVVKNAGHPVRAVVRVGVYRTKTMVERIFETRAQVLTLYTKP